MNSRDPYQVLGIGADASGADIVRAYSRVARMVHPDSRPGDPSAAAEFRAACDAYVLLSDPGRRAAYDRRHRFQAPSQARPGSEATAAPALWPSPLLAGGARNLGPVHGATLRAGPVRIEPPGPPGCGAADSGAADSGAADYGPADYGPADAGSSVELAWLAYRLLGDPWELTW